MRRMKYGIGLIAFIALFAGSLVFSAIDLKAQEQVPLEIKSYEELVGIFKTK